MAVKKKYQFIVNISVKDNRKAEFIHHQLTKYTMKKYSHRVTINKIYKIIYVNEIDIIQKFKYQFIVSVYSTDDYKAELIYNQLKDYILRVYSKPIRVNKIYKVTDIEKERKEKEEKKLLKTLSNVSILIRWYNKNKKLEVEEKQIFGFPQPLNNEIKIEKRTYQKFICED